jgi:myxalamid-type polyketide synthase MxaE and MxaD
MSGVSPMHTAVAIVGIGCRFPGGVVDPASFWRLLRDGADAITEIPPDRIDLEHYFNPTPATPGRIMTRWGGFLSNIKDFDTGFFAISPREAERMDPQQRLLLETAWEALEDAGVNIAALDGSPTGVFVGQWLSDFEARLFANPEDADFYMTTGSGRYSASGRISYVLGLRGASLTLDTACSSSLVAVHLAVRSIRSGESALALAGGVNVILQPHISVAYSQSRMMAPDGRCKFGDASGDGYVRSEGAALIVLKSLARALADGDRIYAVIRGSAVNNDGRSSGSMGTPSRVGQEELLRRAYADAGVAPGRVGYIEAHGTGTRAGDPVELGALGAVLGEGRGERRAYVGSVKTNIGHTEGAAGVAGLIKVALALHHCEIPKSLHCHELNPAIPWAEMPLEIAREATPWAAPVDGTRVGGVSAFGIAGTNAHVVLEECAAPSPAADISTDVESVLTLSARSPDALRALAGRYRDLLGDEQVSVRDVCWAAATRRTALDHRAVVVAADRAALRESLATYADGDALAIEGRAAPTERPRVAFVCPGQGAQWVGMARDLAARAPVFRAALQQCDEAARPYVTWSIVGQIHAQPGTAEYLLDQIDVIQPVLVSLSIAYAQLLRSLGVEPDAVVGHSMGEVAAAHIAGVLDLDQAMRIICRRSALMRTTSGRGSMALVELSMDEARARIAGHEAHISVAVSNSPRSSVISGLPEAVQQVLSGLERDGVFCRLVKVDVASHSPQMQPLAETLGGELAGMTPHAATIPIYSTVLARRAEGDEFGASYWSANLRQPVLFTDAVARMLEDGITAFVELGPHPVLLPSVQQTAQAIDRSVVTVPCGRREEPEWINMLGAVGALWAVGAPIDWRRVLPPGARHVNLPLQPWQRERHWLSLADAAISGATRRRTGSSEAPRHQFLGAVTELGGTPPGHLWEPQLNLQRSPFLGEHLLHGSPVLAASAYVEMALAAARALDAPGATIESLVFEQALYLDSDSPPPVQMRAESQGAAISLTWHSAAGHRWIRHASARVVPARASSEALHSCPHAGRFDDGAEIYARLDARGVAFGASLRGIARAWIGDAEAVAELTPPASASAPRNMELAPWMLDACFQLAAASRPGDELWLPSRVGRISYWPQNGTPERADLRVRAINADGTQELDVTLHGELGVVLQLDALCVGRLSGRMSSDPHEWLHQITWTATDDRDSPQELNGRAFVIVTDRGGVGEALANALRESATVLATEAFDKPSLERLLAQVSASARAVDLVLLRGLDAVEPSAASIRICAEMVDAIQALDRLDTVPRRLWVITRGARVVKAEDAGSIAIAQAPLWGLASAAAAEHRALWGGCLDLDPAMNLNDQATWLRDALASGRLGDAAVRGGARVVPVLGRVDAPSSVRPFELRPDAAYLLTGGLGGVGTQVARWLIARGARRLVILGRTALPPRAEWATVDAGTRAGRAVGAIRGLEACGASIHYGAVDVSDQGAVSRFFDAYRAEQWPEVRGLVHAAGVIDDRLLTQLDGPSLANVFSGKVNGAWNLHRLFPSVDFFLLFSSVAAIVAQPGQGSYAAANAFLDALAYQRQATGQSALSVNWGVWQGLGFADTAGGAQAQEQLSRLGFGSFNAQGALAALDLLVERQVTQAAVLPIDGAALRRALDERSIPPAAASLLGTLAEAPAAATPDAPSEGAFVERLRSEPAARQRQMLEERLVRHAATILRLGAGKLDRRTPLGSYGLNSLMALELRNRIESDLNLQVVATVLWNYPTILSLAEYLLGRLAPAPAVASRTVAVAAETSQPLSDATAAIEAMSDEEALAALSRGTPSLRSAR